MPEKGGAPVCFVTWRGWFVAVHAGFRERPAKRDVLGGSGAVHAPAGQAEDGLGVCLAACALPRGVYSSVHE